MRKEGIPKLGGEEETMELWGWEWGIPKCWGVRGGGLKAVG